MKIFKTRLEIKSFLSDCYVFGQSIGFVPTMGALHQGHLSLIKDAKEKSDVVVCSIFVNPIQFNDPEDLAKYPRPIDKDIELLRDANCDVLFLPELSEIYAGNAIWNLNLDGLDTLFEGALRPGHYQAVTQVVKILFDIISPDFAFFGQKDYQQVLVIKKMISKLNMKVNLIMCPTLREQDGLAMSSRNIYLSKMERTHAPALFKVLQLTQDGLSNKSIQKIRTEAIDYLATVPDLRLDYFQICDSLTLAPMVSAKNTPLVALIAARFFQTRLIDNILLKYV